MHPLPTYRRHRNRMERVGDRQRQRETDKARDRNRQRQPHGDRRYSGGLKMRTRSSSPGIGSNIWEWSLAVFAPWIAALYAGCPHHVGKRPHPDGRKQQRSASKLCPTRVWDARARAGRPRPCRTLTRARVRVVGASPDCSCAVLHRRKDVRR
eukprot:COSAG03_NODE_1780_length_3531_cov_11.259324_2_plen_153_part_00